MSLYTSPPYALEVTTEADVAFEIAESLGLLEETTALSVSLFDRPEGQLQVQALYETQGDAETAAKAITLDANIYQLPETDWVSKTQSDLPPVKAGRFFVHGSHDADNIPEGVAHPILIDAGMAFGTGHHGTTKGCLVILDELLETAFSPQSILDLGCGAGILAIAAAKAMPDISIMASDIDPEAIEVTKVNAKRNEVGTNIDAFQADGFGSPKLAAENFDLIFANILAGPLMGLAPDIYVATAQNGHVILSGILSEQADTVSAAFRAVGFQVSPRTTLEGWTSLLAIRA